MLVFSYRRVGQRACKEVVHVSHAAQILLHLFPSEGKRRRNGPDHATGSGLSGCGTNFGESKAIKGTREWDCIDARASTCPRKRSVTVPARKRICGAFKDGTLDYLNSLFFLFYNGPWSRPFLYRCNNRFATTNSGTER